jgi:hypothetical protein
MNRQRVTPTKPLRLTKMVPLVGDVGPGPARDSWESTASTVPSARQSANRSPVFAEKLNQIDRITSVVSNKEAFTSVGRPKAIYCVQPAVQQVRGTSVSLNSPAAMKADLTTVRIGLWMKNALSCQFSTTANTQSL